jgi:hypothetical protein
MTLLIATPVRGAELGAAVVAAGYSESVRALAQELPLKTVLLYSLDVVRARNRVVSMLLHDPHLADVTHVLWWDDDQWPEDRRIVREMMALDIPIVAAPYTSKRQPLRWVHQAHLPSPDGGRMPLDAIDDRGCFDVRACGFGFTLTSRACLETLSRDPDTEWYWDLPRPVQCPNLFGQLYDELVGKTVLLSEDYSFCKRLRDAGGTVKVYARAGIIYHAGMHAWSAREMAGGIIE